MITVKILSWLRSDRNNIMIESDVKYGIVIVCIRFFVVGKKFTLRTLTISYLYQDFSSAWIVTIAQRLRIC